MTGRLVAALDKLILRLPDGMRDRLAARAKANGRSANAEAVLGLKVWLEQWDWIDAKAEGKKLGPWPGMIPDPLPEDLRLKVLAAAKSYGRHVDEEIVARLQTSFAVDPPNGELSKSPPLAPMDEERFRRLLDESLQNALKNSILSSKLTMMDVQNWISFRDSEVGKAYFDHNDKIGRSENRQKIADNDDT